MIQVIGRPVFEDGLRTGTTVEVITESHSIHTNPEASVRPRVGKSDSLPFGLKTQSLHMLDQLYYCGSVVRIELT